jgi:hypothetical protein
MKLFSTINRQPPCCMQEETIFISLKISWNPTASKRKNHRTGGHIIQLHPCLSTTVDCGRREEGIELIINGLMTAWQIGRVKLIILSHWSFSIFRALWISPCCSIENQGCEWASHERAGANSDSAHVLNELARVSLVWYIRAKILARTQLMPTRAG